MLNIVIYYISRNVLHIKKGPDSLEIPDHQGHSLF